MNKQNIIAGTLIGVLFAVGSLSLARADAGVLETLKDAVIAMAAKIFELDSRVTNLENATTEGTGANVELGGVSNVDMLDVTWLRSGAVASTTDGTWKAHVRLRSQSSDGSNMDFWRNNTTGNVFVGLNVLASLGISSSTEFYIDVATSSTSNLADYTYSSGTGNGAFGLNDSLIHVTFGTSTEDFSVAGTSTIPVILKSGEYIVLKIGAPRMCVGGSDTSVVGVPGKCEAASSTTRGFDVDAILNVFATSTPPSNTSR